MDYDVLGGNKMRKKGFTLIELLIVIALIPIILAVAFQFLNFGLKGHKMSSREYEIQSNMRMAIDKTNETVKYSTSLFVIPKGSFKESNLDQEWSYIGVSEDGREIVQYKSAGIGKTHSKIILVPSQEGIKYEVTFLKESSNTQDKLLKMMFVSVDEKNGNRKMNIDTQLSAINAGFVKDYGTTLKPGVALAYRDDQLMSLVPEKENVGTLTFVMDVSGSMADPLKPKDNKTRLAYLKEASNQMIDKFAMEKDLDFRITLIPFSSSANYPEPMSVLKNNDTNHPTFLISQLSNIKFIINNLKPFGATNTGDGIRRAYYNTLSNNNVIVNQGKNPNNYLIVLVDGTSTVSSVVDTDATAKKGSEYGDHNRYIEIKNKSYKFNLGNKGVNNNPKNGVFGKGSGLDDSAKLYVDTIGKMITDDKVYQQVYVIGFSSIKSEMESVKDIAAALGIENPDSSKYVYDFSKNQNLDLSDVLDQIREDIIQQLWRVDGPKF